MPTGELEATPLETLSLAELEGKKVRAVELMNQLNAILDKKDCDLSRLLGGDVLGAWAQAGNGAETYSTFAQERKGGDPFSNPTRAKGEGASFGYNLEPAVKLDGGAELMSGRFNADFLDETGRPCAIVHYTIIKRGQSFDVVIALAR